MDTITHAQLRALAETGTPPAISLFVPTHRAGSAVRQDPIELKKLLREAETRLVDNGMRGTEARDLLKPAQDLADDPLVWSTYGGEGLAIFISAGIFQAYGLPIAPEPQVVVNNRFHVKALLPILADHEFYILAVSKRDVRLLRSTRTSYQRVELPDDVETNIDRAVLRTGEHDLQVTAETGGAIGAPGESIDLQNRFAEDLRFFLRQIDDGVRRAVPENDALMVLAGDINITPTYREITKLKLKDIADETIRGNQDVTTDEVLHAKGLEIVAPLWEKELIAEQESFGTALAQGKASNNVREIVLAAMDGRVNTLFISPTEKRWGRVSEENRSVELHETENPGDEELLDWATIRTMQTSGRILVVDKTHVPGEGPIAAVMRY